MNITITEDAKNKLQTYDVPEGANFKISTIFSGGCSYTYDFEFALDYIDDKDTKFEDNGIVIYLDQLTLKHTNEDLKLDYVQGKGFRLVGASQIYSFYLEVKRKVTV
ncbi:iron-sulfur cluster biosynthesis family protein [Niallia sp. 01092]|uniref:iron-sulfur cluster biosynthesis family protein n=1 Tax=unclassified Niallia TaxID=2837522 RepID=UPI003FD56537